MKADKYPVISTKRHRRYEFLSDGPNGTIKKVVEYQKIGPYFFNLAFGDWDEESQMLSDKARSNNEDKNKVLATVAFTVMEFMQHYPDTTVLARGSTPSRTRLYQMGIKANLPEMSRLFSIEGFIQGELGSH